MSQHLAEYNLGLAQYLLAGVAACYRGFRLFDTPAVQAVVAKWVAVYKQFRGIITSDIVHIRRPDGQGLDSFMHVNPGLSTCGFVAVFNPTAAPVTQTLVVPLYYTGLNASASFSQEGGAPQVYALARDYSVTLELTLDAMEVTWFAVSAA